MGGVPHAAFLSLAAPSSLSQRWIDEFIRGLLQLANRYGVQLAGGDTAQSLRGVLADIVVLGSAPKGQAIRRSGAKPGDLLYVTGTLGSSVAVLNELRKGKKLRPHSYPRHFYPEPRITVGRYLRERKLATAMIDISDGLSTDLAHICDESKAGAVVYASTLPVVERENALTLALHGGEDYELLFAARPESRIPREILGVPVTRIGEVIPGKQVRLAKANGRTEILRPRGWQHFS
jgi:thiamine-monophosphate kinase